MVDSMDNKGQLREWGRSLITILRLGVLACMILATAWAVLVIWTPPESQWKMAGLLGTATSLILGTIIVKIRLRILEFMAYEASDFSL